MFQSDCPEMYEWPNKEILVTVITLFKPVQEHTWSKSGVFLLGWNENLQPHGPLLDQFDTPDLNHFILFPHNIIHLLSSQYLF